MDKMYLIYPELLISISIMFLLMFGVFIKKSAITVYNLSSISLFVSLIFTAILNFDDLEAGFFLFPLGLV